MSAHAIHGAASKEMHQEVAHQFEDLEQQNDSYVVGMWTFLVTEIMFFGALFLAFATYRTLYTPAFVEAHQKLSFTLGTINTTILLFSSLFMALAVHAAQIGKRGSVIGWIVLTLFCATAFLGIKSVEYYNKYQENLIPGVHYAFEHEKGPLARTEIAPSVGVPDMGGMSAGDTSGVIRHADKTELFFALYFCMTGLHAIHIIIGMLCMVVIVGLLLIKHPAVNDYMPIEMFGLYWHFVDIVWIFLFPLLYLVGH